MGIGPFAIEAFRARGLEPPRVTVITYSVHMRDKSWRPVISHDGLRLHFDAAWQAPSLKALPVELDNGVAHRDHYLKNRTLSPLEELFIKTTRAVVKPLTRARPT